MGNFKHYVMILFLGSGVSLPTQLPGVDELTRAVLSGEWHKHTDQLFYSGRNPSVIDADPTLVIQRFLRFLKGLADAGFAKEGRAEANYEDLFFICKQLQEHEDGMGRNVSILPFLESMRISLEQFLVDQRHLSGYHSPLHGLASMSCTLIQSVVQKTLHTVRDPVGLDLVLELVENTDTTIVTLNHDILVEWVLRDGAVAYRDGFSEPDGDVRWFDEKLLRPGDGVVLLKPHGSIDWSSFFPTGGTNRSPRMAILVGNDRFHSRTQDGDMLDNSGNPEFLTGVGNKIGSYNSGIFAEMMFRFHEVLKSEQQIVMSGYGWADQGINVRLVDWLLMDKNRKLFLLHERPEEFRERLTPLTFRRDDLRE
ncbi:MAG: hypothetical protein EOP84_15180, partial [Verrucomicrobiaceae bacterium]